MAASGHFPQFFINRPVGHTDINCHLVFDIKMNLNLKDHYIAGGYLKNSSGNVPIYASFVSSESVRTLFLISALYNISVFVAKISNAFLNVNLPRKFVLRQVPNLIVTRACG